MRTPQSGGESWACVTHVGALVYKHQTREIETDLILTAIGYLRTCWRRLLNYHSFQTFDTQG